MWVYYNGSPSSQRTPLNEDTSINRTVPKAQQEDTSLFRRHFTNGVRFIGVPLYIVTIMIVCVCPLRPHLSDSGSCDVSVSSVSLQVYIHTGLYIPGTYSYIVSYIAQKPPLHYVCKYGPGPNYHSIFPSVCMCVWLLYACPNHVPVTT